MLGCQFNLHAAMITRSPLLRTVAGADPHAVGDVPRGEHEVELPRRSGGVVLLRAKGGDVLAVFRQFPRVR